MTTLSTETASSATSGPYAGRTGAAARIGCALAAAGTLVPFALCSLTGDTGGEVTAALVDDTVVLQIGSSVALVVAAGLMVAGARLTRHVAVAASAGVAARLVPVAAAAVAVLFAAYYAAFGAGAVVASGVAAEAGPGIGESTWVVLNVVELTRYAPGLALVAAAVALRGLLPRGVWICAAVLVVLTLFPLTSWVAALLIPLWLAVTGAVLPDRAAPGR